MKRTFKGLIVALSVAALTMFCGACSLGQPYQGGECKHEKWGASEVVAATCTEAGSVSRKCLDCGKVETEVVAAKGHTSEVVAGKAATCTEDGMTDGAKCSVCGTVLVEEKEIEAYGHTLVIVDGMPATCTEDGMTAGAKCGDCGEILVAQKTIAARGHKTEVIPGVAATCTATGLTDGEKCTVCKMVLVAQEEIAVIPHTVEVIPGTAATCTNSGVSDGEYCTACETVLTEQAIIPALGHEELVHEGKEPSCAVAGWEEYVTCERSGCDYTTYEEIPVTNIHAWNVGEVTVQPTCTEMGEKTFTCTVCFVNDTEEIPASGHVGNNGETCSVCGEIVYPINYTLADISEDEQFVGSWYRFQLTTQDKDDPTYYGPLSYTVKISNGEKEFYFGFYGVFTRYLSINGNEAGAKALEEYFTVIIGNVDAEAYVDVYIPENITIEIGGVVYDDSGNYETITEEHTLTSDYKITEGNNLQYVKRLVETDSQA